MDVEYDAQKRNDTLEQRNLDFSRCLEVFEEPHLTVEDNRRDYGEDRYITVGLLDDRMVVFVWTWRGSNIRIISMRKANEREQALYRPRLALL